MYDKCYRWNEEIELNVKAFYEIKGMDGSVEELGGEGFDIGKWYKKLCGLYKACEKMYNELNDFIGSSWAYNYIMPRANALSRYILYGERIKIVNSNSGREERYYILRGKESSLEEKQRVSKWQGECSAWTVVNRADGSKEELTNLEYYSRVIRRKGMAMAGRYYMHYNIQYLEIGKTTKSYPPRMRVLRSAVWWANQMLLNIFGLRMCDGGLYNKIQPRLIIFSTMPSSGKSYICNTMNEMFVLLARMIQEKGGVLRVGNEQNNILGQSRQTIGLLLNPLIIDMYPEMGQYVSTQGKYMPFEKGAEEEWSLKGVSYTPAGCIFKTRDSAINSVRCQLGMFDDPSRGQQESANMTIHQRICNLFNGDFQDRFESQDKKRILLTGTMFNPEDVFATEINKALENGFKKDERFKNTYISMDGDVVVIVNDCEDEYGNSAFPEFISTKDLITKRNSLPEYDYRCIWRQKPIPADGLIFAREYLSFYDELPPVNELSDYAFAALDPTRRRASDFLSMPIFKYHAKSGKYYLVDIIYQRKSVLQLYDRIIDKILMHKIVTLVYEENTDTSLGTAIKEKLEKRNAFAVKWCDMQQIFSTENKLARINSMSNTIIQSMVFPSEKFKNTKTELGYAVHELVNFNGDKNEHDDFPDSLAMFADKVIVNSNQKNYIKGRNKRPY